MTIIPRLLSIYRAAGFEPVTGYNSYHFGNYMDAPFTRFVKDSRIYGQGAGLALQEVMFVENFRDFLDARSVLVVGNSYGWSTLALSLIFPQARVVAIDPNQEGNAITNQIAAANGMNVLAAEGWSPQDVGGIVAANLPGPIDLVLVDALHENDAVIKDFQACRAVAGDKTVYLFHDVMNWGMVDAFAQICGDGGLTGRILTRTASGMAVAWKTISPALQEYVEAFCDNMALYRQYRQHCMGDGRRIESSLNLLFSGTS